MSSRNFGPQSEIIDLNGFIQESKEYLDTRSNATIGTETSTSTHSHILNTIQSIRNEDDTLLSTPAFTHSLKLHSDRFKTRRKTQSVDIHGVTAPPQQCFQDTDDVSAYISASQDVGVLPAVDVTSRGKRWDWRCAVVDMEVLSGSRSEGTDDSQALHKEYVVALDTNTPLIALIDRIKCHNPLNLQGGCVIFARKAFFDTRHDCSAYVDAISKMPGVDIGVNSVDDHTASIPSATHATLAHVPLRTGSVGWYVHNGNCEHLLHVASVRLKAIKEVLPRYKFMREQRTANKIVCDVCEKKLAHRATYLDSRGAARSTFWCDTCFHLLNSEHDIEKLQVYQL